MNNDHAELQAQATFIRTEFEKAIASAALGYLDKWKSGTTDASRAHAIAEGLGFIYSLRYATIYGGDATFSDDILEDLIGSENGYWDLTATKINAAAEAIKNIHTPIGIQINSRTPEEISVSIAAEIITLKNKN